MIHKDPRPKSRKWIKRGAAVLFVAEAISFLVSYRVWSQLNTDRDYRLYMRDNYPSILEGYYTFGEKIGGSSVRSYDSLYWSKSQQ